MSAFCAFSVLITCVAFIHEAKACPLPYNHATTADAPTGIELSRLVFPASYHVPSIQHILYSDVAKRLHKSRWMNVIVHDAYFKNSFLDSALPRNPVHFSTLRNLAFRSLSVQKRWRKRKRRSLSAETIAVPTTNTAVAVAIATAGTPARVHK